MAVTQRFPSAIDNWDLPVILPFGFKPNRRCLAHRRWRFRRHVRLLHHRHAADQYHRSPHHAELPLVYGIRSARVDGRRRFELRHEPLGRGLHSLRRQSAVPASEERSLRPDRTRPRCPAHPWQATGQPGASAPPTSLPCECRLPAGLTVCDGIGMGTPGAFRVPHHEGLDHWSSELGTAPAARGGAAPERMPPASGAGWAVFDKPPIAGSVRASKYGANTRTNRTHEK
jgi:hypothetical protein